jgi:hypothetical protein
MGPKPAVDTDIANAGYVQNLRFGDSILDRLNLYCILENFNGQMILYLGKVKMELGVFHSSSN